MKTHGQGNDLYTKTILTVIALALCLIGLNPWIAPTTAIGEGPVPVKIVSVRGKIPVSIESVSSIAYLYDVPVKVKNWP
jgi:hypothetical protein